MSGRADPPSEVLPPYSYVPGGPWPHPFSSSGGHSAKRIHDNVSAILENQWWQSPEYLQGVTLFNAGYYWESHEEWEALWHSHGRRGATADLLRGLIKLAAAGVKVREHQPHGVRTHGRRAAEVMEASRLAGGDHQLGLYLPDLIERARQIADAPPTDSSPAGTPVSRVFRFAIEPKRDEPPI
jgi:uncharacterized protein